MTSRNLFFKLAKEDLKRRVWLAALAFLTFFFGIPVNLALGLSNIKERYERGWQYGGFSQPEEEALLEAAERLFGSYQNVVMVCIMIALAVICGASSFAYLHNKRKVDFYHSIPVKRELLFAAGFTMGIAIPAVLYAVCLGIAMVVAAAYGVPVHGLTGTIVTGWLFHMLFFILIYSTVSLAMIMTGNLIVGLLGSAVFFCYFPWLGAMIELYFNNWFETYLQIGPSMTVEIMKISPVVSYVLASGGSQQWEHASQLITYQGFLGLCAFASVVLIALCVILYKKRPSEAAGKAMAFAVSKPVIRIALTVLFSVSGALFFWVLHSSTGWAVFGAAVGGVLCHAVIEIIYSFDFRRLFDHKIQMGICVALGMAVLFCFKNDWLGYDTYLPKKEQIAEAAINFDNERWQRYAELERTGEDGETVLKQVGSTTYIFENMAVTDTEPVLAIAKKGIEYALAEKYSEEDTEAEGQYWTEVSIQYTLKNGRRVHRYYSLPLSEVWEAACAVSADAGYQTGKYPVLLEHPKDITLVQYRVQGSGKVLEEASISDKAAAGQLLEAYQQDFAELDLNTRQRENPIGELRFLDETEAALSGEAAKLNRNGDIEWWNEYAGYYPIYPSFARTLGLLNGAGIDPQHIWEKLDVQSILISRELEKGDPAYREEEEDYWQAVTMTYQEEDDIRQILEAVTIDEYNNMNAYSRVERSVAVSISLKLENRESSIEGYFLEGTIPPAVEADLEREVRKEK